MALTPGLLLIAANVQRPRMCRRPCVNPLTMSDPVLARLVPTGRGQGMLSTGPGPSVALRSLGMRDVGEGDSVRFRGHTANTAIAAALAMSACDSISRLDQYGICDNCAGGDEVGDATVAHLRDGAVSESSTTEDGSLDGARSVDGEAALDAALDASRGELDGATDGAGPRADGGGDAQGRDAAGDASDGGDLASGLVAFYTFDETSGTSAADSSGNNHTATLVGGATFAAGLENNAVTLSGSSQYVSLPTGIVSGLSSFSITAWVKLTTSPIWNRVFDFGTGTTDYMFFTPNSGSTTRFSITTGSGAAEQQTDAPALPTGSWEHVAVTLSGTTCSVYVQGAEAGKNTNVTLTPSSLGSTTQNWLGRSEYAADAYLQGQLDNVRIYSRALTAAEVQQLYAGHL